MPARRNESQTADPATAPASPSSAKMPAPTMAPMPRKAAPRTLKLRDGRRGNRRCGRLIAEEEPDDQDPHEGCDDPAICSGSWKEWSTTRLPSDVVPVVSASAAAICVPFAGRKSTPTTAVQNAIM